jgi:hypothetical protein
VEHAAPGAGRLARAARHSQLMKTPKQKVELAPKVVLAKSMKAIADRMNANPIPMVGRYVMHKGKLYGPSQ